MEESRRADRFSIEQVVSLVFSHNKRLPAKAVNISSTGILVAMDEEVEPGTIVKVNLCSEKDNCDKIIKAEGVVTRSSRGMKDYFAAIDFTSVEGEGSEPINKFH
jgi:hypothetical protein